MRAALCLLVFCSIFPAYGQRGDSRDLPGTVQTDPIPESRIPRSPPHSAAEEMKTFRLQAGFHLDLVAGEPLVHDPIALAFGPAGRLWVVEMSGYMPNVDGKGEDQPVGKIVVLESSRHDGHYDTRTVFADKLVLPRAIARIRDGLLVGEPPHLWFYPIIDGDKAGRRVEVLHDFGSNYNPQGAPNGLMWGLDNWIYCACWTTRLRNLEGDWERGPTIQRGEWGISQDDLGRIVYDSNEDQFRIDLSPAEYLLRNPDYRSAVGINVDPIHDQTVWPAHMTPGVNRGYSKGILRPDGTLAKTTAACGPLIYRGDNFPAEFRGNAFVCEPAGNLIIRDILTETTGDGMTGREAYGHSEFLASTDERFRPTSLYNGPDGALYLVDMYRGVIEHRLSVTTYLRRQIKARHLEQPLGLGRIYRIYYGDTPPAGETLADLDSTALVPKLGSPRGWVQDTAQRLIVERDNPAVIPLLRRQALESTDPITQIHSAWTLDGLGQVDAALLGPLLNNPSPKVRAAAVRLSESVLTGDLLTRLTRLAQSEDAPEVLLQLSFTLGQNRSEKAFGGLLTLAQRAANDPMAREALASSLSGRELRFLEALLPTWAGEQPGRSALIDTLTQCVVNERDTHHVDHLLQLASAAASWQREVIIDSIAGRLVAKPRQPRAKPLLFAAKPAGLAALETRADASRISPFIVWPGKPGYVAPPAPRPLTLAEEQRLETGRKLYGGTCVACHQPSGLGLPGVAPPLVDSEWVLGPEQRLVRILLQGAQGPIHAAGVGFDSEMPSWGAFNDEQIAGLLTFIRRNWENAADPISPATVARIRAQVAGRHAAWTAGELSQVK